MIRKFWLENSLGAVYKFTDRDQKHFLSIPEGLGFVRNYTINRLGNEAIVTSEQATLPQVKGQIIFNGATNQQMYQAYSDFVQFAKMRPLKLHYQTPNSFNNLYIECEIAQLDKGEITAEDGMLHCPIAFFGLSFWKEDIEHDLIVKSGVSGGTKTYPYTIPYTYSGNNYQNIKITNNGTMAVGFKMEIEDAVTNPTLQLYQMKNNELVKYGEIKVNGTYDYVLIDTRDSKQDIILKVGDSVIANPTSYFDLSGDGEYETPFPKLRLGESKLAFSFSGNFSEELHIKWQDNFITY